VLLLFTADILEGESKQCSTSYFF